MGPGLLGLGLVFLTPALVTNQLILISLFMLWGYPPMSDIICACPQSQTDIPQLNPCLHFAATVIKVNAMTPELVVNLVCPGLIIPFGTVGNCLALWTLFLSDLLRKRIVRYES